MIKIMGSKRCSTLRYFLRSLLTIFILTSFIQVYSQTPESDTYTQTPKFTNENKPNRVATFKGLFINNFIKYVAWPKNAVKDTFRLGVLNDRVLEKILKRATRKISFGVDSLPIKVIFMDNLDDISNLNIHMLYSDFEKNSYSAKKLFSAIGDSPTLLITENYDFGATMINFITIGIQPKFEINIENTKQRGFEVDPRMINYSLKTNKEEFKKLLSGVRQDLDKEVSINVKQTKKIEDLSNDIQERIRILALKEEQLNEIQKNIEVQNLMSQQLKHLLDSSKNLVEQKEAEIAISEQYYDGQLKKLEKAEADLEEIELKRSEALRSLDNQKIITYVSIVIIFIVAFLLFIALRNYQKQKQLSLVIIKQKEEVEGQRDEISKQHIQLEEKTKEITDSINYAKRIQEAILPPVHLFENHLKNYFIFYLPKDIVAGDFYWMEVVGPNVIFAAADCTGHGVPGALVSVLCSNALNRAVKEHGIIEPGKILDKTLEIILEKFTQAEETVKDGMDISLCSYNRETREYSMLVQTTLFGLQEKEAMRLKNLYPINNQ